MEELTLEVLLTQINSDDADVRTQAWQAAGAIGAPAIKPLAAIVARGDKPTAKARMTELHAEVPGLQREVNRLRRQVDARKKQGKPVDDLKKELAEKSGRLTASQRELDMLLECPRAAKRAMWKIVRTVGAPGQDDGQKAVVAELLSLVGPEQPAAVRREVFWMLSEIGGDETVMAMRQHGEILDEKVLREDARCMVERIPGEAAIEAFEDALAEAPEDYKINIAQSLRARGVKVDPAKYPCQKLVPTKQTNVKPVGR